MVSDHVGLPAEALAKAGGFGSALLFIRDGIIRDIIRRYKNDIPPEGLISKIEDTSHSSKANTDYSGWTNTRAQEMGYTENDGLLNKSYKI